MTFSIRRTMEAVAFAKSYYLEEFCNKTMLNFLQVEDNVVVLLYFWDNHRKPRT